MSSGTWPKPHSLVRIRRSRGKCFSAGSTRLRDHVDRLDVVAALVDHAEAEVALEVPELPEVHEVVAQRAVLEQHLVDLHLAEGRREVGVFGEVDALAPRIAAADVQPDADVSGSESISSLRMSAAHSLCCGASVHIGSSNWMSVQPAAMTSSSSCFEHVGPGAAEGLIVRIEVLALVDAEAGQHMRAGDGLLDAHVRRARRRARASSCGRDGSADSRFARSRADIRCRSPASPKASRGMFSNVTPSTRFW